MENPVIRFIVAAIATLVAFVGMTLIWTLLGVKGRFFYMISFVVAAGVWSFVSSIGKKDKDDTEDTNEAQNESK